MKLRLSSDKTTIRISGDEFQILQKTKELIQKFWLSDHHNIEVALKLAELSGFESSESGYRVVIAESEFIQQKNKKDQPWQLFVNNNFSVAVEVDLKNPDRKEVS